MPNEFEDLIGAVAEDQIGGGQVELGGEPLLEVEGISVRVEVDLADGLAHGCLREAGRAKRVLVRGQLYDIVGGQAEFAGDFLDRTPRLIDGHAVQGWVGGEGEGHGSFECLVFSS